MVTFLPKNRVKISSKPPPCSIIETNPPISNVKIRILIFHLFCSAGIKWSLKKLMKAVIGFPFDKSSVPLIAPKSNPVITEREKKDST